MKLLTNLLGLAMTAAVLVGVALPTEAAPAPDVRPSTPALLREIGADQNAGSARLGDSLVFTGISNGDYEPWITDGTPEGTRRIVDIAPDTSSGPAYYASYQGRVYFTAFTRELGTELWVTDGTAGGTHLVEDISEGAGSSHPRYLTVAGGRLFFKADTAATGRELWVTDGTAAGTRLHTDLNPGAASGNAYALTEFGGRLLFAASPAANVYKPYVAGPAPGAVARLDVEPIGVSVPVDSFARVGDRAVFGADELWLTRGVVGDARVLKDIWTGGDSRPWNLTSVGDRVVFTADTPATGREVWSSDGTPAGTGLLEDVWPGVDGGGASSVVTTSHAGFFHAPDGDVRELWVTGGTPGSTRQVARPQPATEVDRILGSAADQVTVLADTADSSIVFSTDGTAAGTRVLPELGPGPDGDAFGIGTVGATQIIEIEPDEGPARLYAWTAARSTTKARPKASYDAAVAQRKQVRVTVLVRTTTGERLSGGLVTLTRKGRVVGRARLVEGVAKVRIRVRLQPGRRHHLRATWTGTVDAAASTSPRFVVRVKLRR